MTTNWGIDIVRKSYITLLELIIVIVIMSIVAGVVGISIGQAKKDQHFRTEVSIVMDKLRLAQNLMLILESDVAVKFANASNGQGVVLRLDFDDILSKNWSKEIKKEILLTEIRSVNFVDSIGGNAKRGEIEIKFFSGGSVMSGGVLRLAVADNDSDAGSLVRYICLAGYPQAITRAVEHQDDLKCQAGQSAETDLDRRLTMYTVEEIPVYPTKSSEAQNDKPAGGQNAPQKAK